MRCKAIVLGTVFLLAASQAVYAGTQDYQTEVINSISIGDISITLDEFELDADGNLIPYQDNKTVLPGLKIDKIVKITNQANRAWIRAKIEYTSDDGIQGMSDDMVTMGAESWKKIGDYYYLTEPLGQSETAEFIRTVRIPPEWDETYSDKSFAVVITADAVQEANFIPDFTSESPWFGTVIETCVHSKYDTVHVGEQSFSIAFEGGAEGLVKVGDDFFSNFGDLMPGDIVSDTVNLRNSYHKPVSLYFRTETSAADELLHAVEIEIRNNEKVIYAGSLDGAITENVQLAFLQSGESAVLSYTLHVPASLDNRYALSKAETKWIFSAELKKTGGGSSSSSEGSKSTAPKPGVKPANPIITPFPGLMESAKEAMEEISLLIPKLGDEDKTAVLLFICIFSGMAAELLLFIPKRKGKRRKGHEKN